MAILLPAALVAYIVGILLAMLGTLGPSGPACRGAQGVLAVAWLFHLAAIVRQGVAQGRFPLSNSTEYLLVLGWVILTFYLVVWLRWRVDAAGLILPPLAALMSLATLLVPARDRAAGEAHQQAWLILHTSLSTLGMAALCVAFAMSLMYLVQDRWLKSKRRVALLDRLPALDTCDRIGYQALLWGFPLLTLGILLGLIGSYRTYGLLWTQGTKEGFALLAWAVLAVLLYARRARGFRGRRSAYVTIAGFALGLAAVVGMTR